MKIEIECALEPGLGAIRLSLVQVNETVLIRYLEFQKVKNVKNWVSHYFKMHIPEFYSQRLENNANDGGTLEVVSGNIGLIRLSFVFISFSVKVYKNKNSSNFFEQPNIIVSK